MKTLIMILAIFAAFGGLNASEKYISKSGHIRFFSKTPLETIDANNNQVASAIDISKGTIAFEALNKAFKFRKALMEEHFNENYMESSTYPKSTFSGKFNNFDLNNFKKDGKYNVVVEGDLKIHGVTKHVKENGTLEIKNGQIIAKAKFYVKPEDYNIEIPGLVRDKIASKIEITVDITYEPKK